MPGFFSFARTSIAGVSQQIKELIATFLQRCFVGQLLQSFTEQQLRISLTRTSIELHEGKLNCDALTDLLLSANEDSSYYIRCLYGGFKRLEWRIPWVVEIDSPCFIFAIHPIKHHVSSLPPTSCLRCTHCKKCCSIHFSDDCLVEKETNTMAHEEEQQQFFFNSYYPDSMTSKYHNNNNNTSTTTPSSKGTIGSEVLSKLMCLGDFIFRHLTLVTKHLNIAVVIPKNHYDNDCFIRRICPTCRKTVIGPALHIKKPLSSPLLIQEDQTSFILSKCYEGIQLEINQLTLTETTTCSLCMTLTGISLFLLNSCQRKIRLISIGNKIDEQSIYNHTHHQNNTLNNDITTTTSSGNMISSSPLGIQIRMNIITTNKGHNQNFIKSSLSDPISTKHHHDGRLSTELLLFPLCCMYFISFTFSKIHMILDEKRILLLTSLLPHMIELLTETNIQNNESTIVMHSTRNLPSPSNNDDMNTHHHISPTTTSYSPKISYSSSYCSPSSKYEYQNPTTHDHNSSKKKDIQTYYHNTTAEEDNDLQEEEEEEEEEEHNTTYNNNNKKNQFQDETLKINKTLKLGAQHIWHYAETLPISLTHFNESSNLINTTNNNFENNNNNHAYEIHQDHHLIQQRTYIQIHLNALCNGLSLYIIPTSSSSNHDNLGLLLDFHYGIFQILWNIISNDYQLSLPSFQNIISFSLSHVRIVPINYSSFILQQHQASPLNNPSSLYQQDLTTETDELILDNENHNNEYDDDFDSCTSSSSSSSLNDIHNIIISNDILLNNKNNHSTLTTQQQHYECHHPITTKIDFFSNDDDNDDDENASYYSLLSSINELEPFLLIYSNPVLPRIYATAVGKHTTEEDLLPSSHISNKDNNNPITQSSSSSSSCHLYPSSLSLPVTTYNIPTPISVISENNTEEWKYYIKQQQQQQQFALIFCTLRFWSHNTHSGTYYYVAPKYQTSLWIAPMLIDCHPIAMNAITAVSSLWLLSPLCNLSHDQSYTTTSFFPSSPTTIIQNPSSTSTTNPNIITQNTHTFCLWMSFLRIHLRPNTLLSSLQPLYTNNTNTPSSSSSCDFQENNNNNNDSTIILDISDSEYIFINKKSVTLSATSKNINLTPLRSFFLIQTSAHITFYISVSDNNNFLVALSTFPLSKNVKSFYSMMQNNKKSISPRMLLTSPPKKNDVITKDNHHITTNIMMQNFIDEKFSSSSRYTITLIRKSEYLTTLQSSYSPSCLSHSSLSSLVSLKSYFSLSDISSWEKVKINTNNNNRRHHRRQSSSSSKSYSNTSNRSTLNNNNNNDRSFLLNKKKKKQHSHMKLKRMIPTTSSIKKSRFSKKHKKKKIFKENFFLFYEDEELNDIDLKINTPFLQLYYHDRKTLLNTLPVLRSIEYWFIKTFPNIMETGTVFTLEGNGISLFLNIDHLRIIAYFSKLKQHLTFLKETSPNNNKNNNIYKAITPPPSLHSSNSIILYCNSFSIVISFINIETPPQKKKIYSNTSMSQKEYSRINNDLSSRNCVHSKSNDNFISFNGISGKVLISLNSLKMEFNNSLILDTEQNEILHSDTINENHCLWLCIIRKKKKKSSLFHPLFSMTISIKITNLKISIIEPFLFSLIIDIFEKTTTQGGGHLIETQQTLKKKKDYEISFNTTNLENQDAYCYHKSISNPSHPTMTCCDGTTTNTTTGIGDYNTIEHLDVYELKYLESFKIQIEAFFPIMIVFHIQQSLFHCSPSDFISAIKKRDIELNQHITFNKENLLHPSLVLTLAIRDSTFQLKAFEPHWKSLQFNLHINAPISLSISPKFEKVSLKDYFTIYKNDYFHNKNIDASLQRNCLFTDIPKTKLKQQHCSITIVHLFHLESTHIFHCWKHLPLLEDQRHIQSPSPPLLINTYFQRHLNIFLGSCSFLLCSLNIQLITDLISACGMIFNTYKKYNNEETLPIINNRHTSPIDLTALDIIITIKKFESGLSMIAAEAVLLSQFLGTRWTKTISRLTLTNFTFTRTCDAGKALLSASNTATRRFILQHFQDNVVLNQQQQQQHKFIEPSPLQIVVEDGIVEFQKSKILLGITKLSCESIEVSDMVRRSRYRYFLRCYPRRVLKKHALKLYIREYIYYCSTPSFYLSNSIEKNQILFRQSSNDIIMSPATTLSQISDVCSSQTGRSPTPWMYLEEDYNTRHHKFSGTTSSSHYVSFASNEKDYIKTTSFFGKQHDESKKNNNTMASSSSSSHNNNNNTSTKILDWTAEIQIEIEPIRITADQLFLDLLNLFVIRLSQWNLHPSSYKEETFPIVYAKDEMFSSYDDDDDDDNVSSFPTNLISQSHIPIHFKPSDSCSVISHQKMSPIVVSQDIDRDNNTNQDDSSCCCCPITTHRTIIHLLKISDFYILIDLLPRWEKPLPGLYSTLTQKKDKSYARAVSIAHMILTTVGGIRNLKFSFKGKTLKSFSFLPSSINFNHSNSCLHQIQIGNLTMNLIPCRLILAIQGSYILQLFSIHFIKHVLQLLAPNDWHNFSMKLARNIAFHLSAFGPLERVGASAKTLFTDIVALGHHPSRRLRKYGRHYSNKDGNWKSVQRSFGMFLHRCSVETIGIFTHLVDATHKALRTVERRVGTTQPSSPSSLLARRRAIIRRAKEVVHIHKKKISDEKSRILLQQEGWEFPNPIIKALSDEEEEEESNSSSRFLMLEESSEPTVQKNDDTKNNFACNQILMNKKKKKKKSAAPTTTVPLTNWFVIEKGPTVISETPPIRDVLNSMYTSLRQEVQVTLRKHHKQKGLIKKQLERSTHFMKPYQDNVYSRYYESSRSLSTLNNRRIPTTVHDIVSNAAIAVPILLVKPLTGIAEILSITLRTVRYNLDPECCRSANDIIKLPEIIPQDLYDNEKCCYSSDRYLTYRTPIDDKESIHSDNIDCYSLNNNNNNNTNQGDTNDKWSNSSVNSSSSSSSSKNHSK